MIHRVVTIKILSFIIAFSLMLVIVRSASALFYVDVDLPVGNSTGGAHPSDGAYCFQNYYT